MIQKYSCGFMFNQRRSSVVLIRKEKPEWQTGSLNGIGGKVEPGEWAKQSMIREYEEEAGVHYEDWIHFATITDNETFEVVFFKASDYDAYSDSMTMEGEEIVKSDVFGRAGDVTFGIDASCLYNLNWLIPLALDEKVKNPIHVVCEPGVSMGTGDFNHIGSVIEEPKLEPQFYKDDKKQN